MGTISIQMKVIADRDTKQKIERAHVLFNEKVRLFEEFLLLARARDYYYTDAMGQEQYKSVIDAQSDLRKFLKGRNIMNIEECVIALSRIESIIESKGSQAALSLAKLYNALSSGGMNNIAKIVDPPPEWIQHFDIGSKSFRDPMYKEMADAWILSEEGQGAISPALNGSGKPSAFKVAYTTGKEWYYPFVNDQNKYRKDLENGLSRMLFDLEKSNALPLVDIDETLIAEYPTWVKLMLKTAIENFASYIACDTTTREEYSTLKEQYDVMKKKTMSNYCELYDRISYFLKGNYVQTDRPVYLTRRMCRGLDEIKFAWKKCANADERIKAVTEWQSDSVKKKKIGDVNFLHWLAADENQDILQGDALEEILAFYDCMRKKDSKRQCASYTIADPVDSKRYLFYEAETGTNYRKYSFALEENKMKISVPILLQTEEGRYSEEEITFYLAPSTQMQNLSFPQKGVVLFSSGKRMLYKGRMLPEFETFRGKMGGADLRVETNTQGHITGIFMSFSITVEQKCEQEWAKMSNAVRFCFGRAYDGKKTKYDDVLHGKTIRALSIDLGLKQFGACAVGKVEYGENLIQLPQVEFERLFMLKLPNEKVDSVTENARIEAMKTVHQLMIEIRYLSLLKRIYGQDEDGRRKLLSRSVEYYKNSDKNNILTYCLNVSDQDSINKCLADEYSRVMSFMNDKMEEFRSGFNTCKQNRSYKPGKSFWSITYLEEIRKLLISWSSLGHSIKDDNKLMNKGYGVTATRLLEHINHIKDDRIKTGADYILMAANGFRYDEEKKYWIQQYEPCNVIIFEDLSRYRFSKDRPSRENSKLMQWAHREIIKETQRQAVIYGIEVYDQTDAAYSSKYSYKTETPGIRCDRLTKSDFDENGKLRDVIFEHLPEALKNKAELLQVGSLVPAEIGSIFATIDSNGQLYTINADLNAACSLMNRFFRMHTHLIRLSTVNVDGSLWIKGMKTDEELKNIGKREKGKFQYYLKTDKVMLVDGENGHFSLVKKQKNLDPPIVGKEKIYNLFRDPSGHIISANKWIGYEEFWITVKNRVLDKLIDIL